jgi:hypothetical protein
MMMLREVEITAVAFQEGAAWSAQCLEFDIAVQAKQLTELFFELQRVIAAHIAVSIELGREPFADLEPAPQMFWRMYEGAKLSVNAERMPFRLSPPSSVRPHFSVFKIAEQEAVCA